MHDPGERADRAAHVNIAFFASTFYPSLGGVEEVCRQLAHAFAVQQHKVTVWTERWPRALPAFESFEDIPIHRFPMRVPADGWKAKLSYLFTHHSIRSQIVRDVQKQGIDVLHVQCVSTTAWYALHVKKVLKLPLVVTLHGELHMDAAGVFQHSEIHKRIMHEVLQQADVITACSHQTLREAEEFHGQPFGQRARVIYNGIDLQEFEAAQSYMHPRRYVLAIGRHVREKGFDVLLEAFARAGDLGQDLLIAGDGPETANLKAMAMRLKIGDKVHFPGRVAHNMAVQLFKGCSFFVLPSRHEPFGIVNLEAMAAGKAIVATRVGGVPEIVSDQENALLIPAENPDALCQALRHLSSDQVLTARLGQGGTQRVTHFGWPDLSKEYLQTYKDVLV